MGIRRYSRSPVIRGGKQLGTSDAVRVIREAVKDGRIQTTTRTLQGEERLDVLAGKLYGDARNWWIIAAASNIGYGLQVPPGTQIIVPTDRAQVASLIE